MAQDVQNFMTEINCMNFANFSTEEFQFSTSVSNICRSLSMAQGLTELGGSETLLCGSQNHTVHLDSLLYDEFLDDTLENGKDEKVRIQEKPLILVAEDDEFNHFYLEMILSKAHFSVIHAVNGVEVVKQCQAHPKISLILMDLKMPIMSGYDATREVKSFRKNLPIIAVTAFAMTDDREKALEAGCDDYLTKPFSRELLLERINKYLKCNGVQGDMLKDISQDAG